MQWKIGRSRGRARLQQSTRKDLTGFGRLPDVVSKEGRRSGNIEKPVGFFFKNGGLKIRKDLFGHHHRAAHHHHFAGTERQLLVAVRIAVIGVRGEVVVVDEFKKGDFAMAADLVFGEMLQQHRKLEQLLQGRLRKEDNG